MPPVVATPAHALFGQAAGVGMSITCVLRKWVPVASLNLRIVELADRSQFLPMGTEAGLGAYKAENHMFISSQSRCSGLVSFHFADSRDRSRDFLGSDTGKTAVGNSTLVVGGINHAGSKP